jgi:glycerol uptake facilitator-like aquaporin
MLVISSNYLKGVVFLGFVGLQAYANTKILNFDRRNHFNTLFVSSMAWSFGKIVGVHVHRSMRQGQFNGIKRLI